MKLYIKIFYIATAFAILTVTGCSKLLEEHPKSQITPQFFGTPGGLLGGISGIYSDMRNIWGTEGFNVICQGGTDDHLAAASASNATYYNYNGVNLDAMGGLWGIAYQDINTLNGILQFGATVTLDSATRVQYLAQAKFLRAMYYFYLVTTFGDVPLHLTFITSPTTSDSRQPMADVYTQIISDLTAAVAGLPPTAPLTATATNPFGGKPATRATAYYLLAKTYLARGWSSAAHTDDFVNAYTTANTLITNAATYGISLWQDFNDANKVGNDYGRETLMVVDHSTDQRYGDLVIGGAGGKVNILASLFRPNYPTMNANYPATGGGSTLLRTIQYGRPFIRTMPNTPYILGQAFAERVNDTRYDKTFQTVWIANTGANMTTPRGTLRNGIDTALWTPPFEVPAARRNAFVGVILQPTNTTGGNLYTNTFFPACRKFDDTTRAGINDPSSRPVILFRFAEVYMIAAEAAFKGGGTLQNAADMINVIRTRAAYSRYRTAAQNAAAVTAMQITAAQVTLDYILDERTREFYGESLRWWDLVRTQSLVRRVRLYNAQAAPYIQDYHTLRPIPQATEIDLVTSGPPFPQNPGY